MTTGLTIESLDVLERSYVIITTDAFLIGTDILGLNGSSLSDLTEVDIQRWTDWYGQWLKMGSQDKAAYQVLLALQS